MIDPKSKTEFARLKERDPAALRRLERAIKKLGVSGAAELYGVHRVTIWKLREK